MESDKPGDGEQRRDSRESPRILEYRTARGPNASSEPQEKGRWRVQLASSLALLTTFTIPVVIAGHGLAPIGLIVLIGSWGAPTGIAWLGVFSLAISLAPARRTVVAVFAVASVACIVTAWVMFCRASEKPIITLATSVPFIAAVVIKLLATFAVWRGGLGQAAR